MRLPALLCLSLCLAGTAAYAQSAATVQYPQAPEDQRRIDRGKITGEGGLTLFGGGDRDSASKVGAGTSLPVNAYLWQASLDTISFMPLASSDPFGGTIITEWYEFPETPGERFKLHVLVRDKALRADGVKVQVFKQKREETGNEWREAAIPPSMARDFENIILSRARELRVKK